MGALLAFVLLCIPVGLVLGPLLVLACMATPRAPR